MVITRKYEKFNMNLRKAISRIHSRRAQNIDPYSMTASGGPKLSGIGSRDGSGKRMFTSEGKIRGDGKDDLVYDIEPSRDSTLRAGFLQTKQRD